MMNQLKKIVKDARKKGLCRPWYDDFRKNHSLKNLCEKYFEGSDWAIERDFPNLETLRIFKGQSDAYGIHTDFVGEIENDLSVIKRVGLFGNSVVTFRAGDFSVSEIIVRHNSNLRIQARGNAFIIVNVLDSAHVEIEALGNSTINVHKYGQNAIVRAKGNVKQFNAQW